MEIFYIENFKVSDELRTICFIKTTASDFMQSLGLDEIYNTEVKLVPDNAPIYYDTTTKAFYKYWKSIKQDEFAKIAINMTLEHGHVMTKIDWSPDFLSPKTLIGKLMQRFIKDMTKHDFKDLYK